MAGRVSSSRRRSRPYRSRTRVNLQKPNGVIAPRVKNVGGERFGIVCVDPAKHRSEWMMADYFGNLLIEPRTLEHQANFFKAAVELIRQAQRQHDIQDTIVVVERTGNYYLAPKRAFSRAGFETRVVHPFATKQYRMPADPGNKTDETDLHAQHRAAVAGFGLFEAELEPPYRTLQLRVRHRRSLVEKASGLACQIREHLHLAMPGYAAVFDRLLENKTAMAIAHRCHSPASMLKLGPQRLSKHLRNKRVRHQSRSIEKVFAWASQAAGESIVDGRLHHAIWTDLEKLYRHFEQQIAVLERAIAGDLVSTPYIRLLAIPGINVVSAGDLAGEMGPITRYANANAITGRSGLFPSRSQSDQTDQNGPIIRQSNRRIRGALMRIADNLACHCAYYRGQANADEAMGIDKRATRVKIAKKFTRLAYACVAGDNPIRHPALRSPDSIIEKLRKFHQDHGTPLDRLLVDLNASAEQLPGDTRHREAKVVEQTLKQQTERRRGDVAIGELLITVLAHLEITKAEIDEADGDRP